MTELKQLFIFARKTVENGWIQGALAMDGGGGDTLPTDPKAISWCALGAFQANCVDKDFAPCGGYLYFKAQELFRKVNNIHIISEWNDAEGRTKEEVLQAFDNVIEYLEASEACCEETTDALVGCS